MIHVAFLIRLIHQYHTNPRLMFGRNTEEKRTKEEEEELRTKPRRSRLLRKQPPQQH